MLNQPISFNSFLVDHLLDTCPIVVSTGFQLGGLYPFGQVFWCPPPHRVAPYRMWDIKTPFIRIFVVFVVRYLLMHFIAFIFWFNLLFKIVRSILQELIPHHVVLDHYT